MTTPFPRKKTLTIRVKLYVLVALMCAALAAVSAAAIRGAQQMAAAGTSLYRDALPGFEHGSRLALLIERERGLVARTPAELDLGRQKAFHDEFKRNADEIESTLRDIRVDARGDVKATLDLIEGDLKLLNQAADNVFELSASFAQDQANQVLNGDYAAVESKIAKNVQVVFDRSRKAAAEASSTLASSHRFLLTVVLSTAGGAVVAALLIGILMVRNVTSRLERLTMAMSRLAEQDLAVEIVGSADRDEIGRMANSVLIFKENMIKADRLAAEQRTEQERKEARQKAVEGYVAEFDKSVQDALSALAAAATEMRATATSMSSTAEETQREAGSVASASEQTSANVQTVAASAEEMTSSISEIGRQVTQASQIAKLAVEDAQRTNGTVNTLAEAAQKIGQVVQLIQDIASQTNLLALNATIEAARAGEAGKGFAVVASEVKSLANQTAKATEEIGGQIASIQTVTGEAVTAIQGIGGTIGQISEISTAIASAVEAQGAATQEIARNTQQAAKGTEQVSANISGVNRAAGETGAAATQVLASAEQLGHQSETLRADVNRFLERIRAA
ncbi:MAG: methyl-accepting chemotaxis protein [Stellaceae bacterium]